MAKERHGYDWARNLVLENPAKSWVSVVKELLKMRKEEKMRYDDGKKSCSKDLWREWPTIRGTASYEMETAKQLLKMCRNVYEVEKMRNARWKASDEKGEMRVSSAVDDGEEVVGLFRSEMEAIGDGMDLVVGGNTDGLNERFKCDSSDDEAAELVVGGLGEGGGERVGLNERFKCDSSDDEDDAVGGGLEESGGDKVELNERFKCDSSDDADDVVGGGLGED